MNFANSDVLDRPTETVRDNIARAEEYLQPRMRQVRRDPIGWAKACVRNFPAAAVFTAFAGGLLIGAAAVNRRQSFRGLMSLDLSEPIQRGGRMLSDTVAAAGEALRDSSDSMRTMARRDMKVLRKEASRWQRMLNL
ncbi:MAG TPA: hypothetical protein VK961_15940 [Chthoniobacter sp.]|nr:hypothetical protein [Chthoniobacter sp.]